MPKKELEIKDLIDITFLQEFQDAFSKAMNIASITYDRREPITKPSNFSDFCTKFTRNSAIGEINCKKCDLKWAKIASEEKKPVIYKCHTGLTDFAVPIIVEDEHIGTIYAGQILTEAPDFEKLRELARLYKIDEEEYIEAAKKLNVIPQESIEAAANLLFLVANAFSRIGNQNIKLLKLSQREILYRTVVEALRNSLDIETTKRQIVNIVGEALGADRCFITEYDENTDKFLIIGDEYLSSKEIQSYKGANVNSEIPNFANALKNGKILIINKGKIESDLGDENFSIEEAIIKKYNVRSAYGIPFKYYNKLLGVLSLHYTNDNHKITDEEFELVKMIASQVGIAIYQAKLFNTIKEHAERERMSKNISEILRSTLDRSTIKHLFVQNIGKYFKADRVFFADYDRDKKIYLPVEKGAEYLSDINQKSFVDYPWTGEDSREYIEPLLNKREFNIIDLDDYLSKNQKSQEFISLFKDADVKSSYNFPVLYEQKIMGYFCIEFTKDVRKLSDDEIISIRSICSQAGIAIYHSILYKNANEAASTQCKLIKDIYKEIKSALSDMLEYSDKIINDGEDPLLTKEYISNLKIKEEELMNLLKQMPENI